MQVIKLFLFNGEIPMQYERIDDIPFILEAAKQLNINQILDKYLNHKNIQGLSYGNVSLAWLSFILSKSNHRKSHLQPWTKSISTCLSTLLEYPINENDFSDDRLSQILNCLSDDEIWEDIEKDLWKAKLEVFDLPITNVKLDSTTCMAYHQTKEEGLIQYGFSKDARKDLPQLKLMAGAEGTYGDLIALNVIEGNRNDDQLYWPMIDQIDKIINKRGVLYSGDCKMSSINNRGQIDKMGNYYLCPLQMLSEQIRSQTDQWIEEIVEGKREALIVFDEKNQFSGGGFEIQRNQELALEDNAIHSFKERVLIFRSSNLAKMQREGLEKRINKAEKMISGLNHKATKFRDKNKLEEKIYKILESLDVQDVITVSLEEKQDVATRQRYEIRNGKKREGIFNVLKNYYEIKQIQRNEESIAGKFHRMGFRIYVTNIPEQKLSFEQLISTYRDNWKLETQFHNLKDARIGISPLFVRTEKQIKGLCRLLSIALRLFTYIENKVRHTFKNQQLEINNVYKGQPKKKTKNPTLNIILEAFLNTSLITIDGEVWGLTPLGMHHEIFLMCLGFPKNLYEGILDKLNNKV